MRRADRLFEIIQILRQSGRPITAAALADRLEVNPRTVYRDIAALQAMRVPIEGAAGIGYLMRRGYDLPPLNFDADEVEAILVGLGLLARTGDPALQSSARRAVDKISAGLPEDRRTLPEKQRFRVSSWGSTPPEMIDMQALRAALRDEQALHISYRDENERETERTVLPVALIYYVRVEVLAAWCRLRKGFRHFRTDRIQNMTVLEETFSDRAQALREEWDAGFAFRE